MAPATKSHKSKGQDGGKQNAKNTQQKKGKGSIQLKDQVHALGGDDSDFELVKGVRDETLVQGTEHEDPALKGDVSKFLRSLTAGKGSAVEPKKKAKSHNDTQPREVPTEKEKKSKDKKRKKISDAPVPEPVEKKPDAVPTITGVTLNKNQGKLVFEPNSHWYSATPPLVPQQKPLAAASALQISSLSERAANLFTADAAAYQASSTFTGKSTSDTHFLNTILSKGTLSDRLSALTLLVQASPVHNTKALETLKSMAERGRGKGGREEGLKAMRCVVDWWIGGGAPGRKLRYFRDQPLLHPSATDQHLIAWYFEDWLKKYFFSILQILETYSLDPLPYVRTQALAFITTLLREKPEQEQNLLRLLVNKLGDTEKSVCSRASYHLLQVLQAHPAMKGVIVRDVRSLVFRVTASTATSSTQPSESKQNSHVRFNDEKSTSKGKAKDKSSHGDGKGHTMERWNSHAWYYASVTLNQVVLSPTEHDRDVARSLIDLYFEMFKEILGGSFSSKFAEDDHGKDKDAPDGHDAKEDKKRKGKAKEVRGDAGFAEVEDENSRLISAVLAGVNRALPFAKLEMGSGSDLLKKHIDTLFLITHTSTFNISLQALMLILQIVTNLPATAPSTSKDSATTIFTTLTDRFYRTLYSSLSDQRLGASNKQAMYLNLLFKALKADKNLERVKAFIRRFIQVLVVGIGGSGGVEFITGGLYLLGELFSTVSGLRSMFAVSATVASEEKEDYDPRKRDPQYAHASASPLYELLPLLHHYHPAVSLHARQLLASQPVTATADLSLNTLSHFLDRFVYKNPKKPKTKGASAMQPAASGIDGASGVKLVKGEVTNGDAPVNDEKFWRRRAEDVPVDELFFHKYFQQKNDREKNMADKVKKRKGKGDESDEEDEEGADEDGESSDEDPHEAAAPEDEADDDSDDEAAESDKEEAEIWKAMKASLPAELRDDDLSLSDGSDDIPSDLDGEELSGLEEDEDAAAGAEASEEEDDIEEDVREDDDDDGLSLVEDSDNEDLLSLDEHIPDGLIDFDEPESGQEGQEEEEWGGIGGTLSAKKRKRGGDEDGKKRKKIRSLPTFASYEDYAKMIEDGPEDNI